MFLSFDHLPDSARMWIYQASRPLSETELMEVQPILAQFATEWTSHGRDLRAGAQFFHRQFLVIGLDEQPASASGCSIDASVRFVHSLEERFGLELLEKSRLAFLLDGTVHLLERRELRANIAAGVLTPEVLYFDNTLTTKSELLSQWPAPAGQTWLRRYFEDSEKKPLPLES